LDKQDFSIVILAAGKGKRMNNPELPKVLVELRAKPLIKYVIETSLGLGPERIITIVGHHKEKVIEYLDGIYGGRIEYAEQNEQLGTGHAVDQTKDIFKDAVTNLLILSGDVPLIRPETLKKFLAEYFGSGADLSVLTADTDNPKGYGRIVRDPDGNFLKIVEEKDASEEVREIKEFNSGVYLVKSLLLFAALGKVSNNNAQGEYYLTDIIEILKNEGHKVIASKLANDKELLGINSYENLMEMEKLIDSKVLEK
jgi:UDP-N-acetylglucosamine diphosphorylase/glucosamine-1-phosphate N-acetyltransferase